MSITFKVHRRSGNYIKTAVIPANHSGEPRFGWIDASIVIFFIGCVGGLIFLLAQH